MEIERADIVSKRCKGNGVLKFMNLQSVMGIRDGIENGDIHEWILVEVLIRLSPKLVCRFKLVSKQWFSIISDPSFVRAYISRASVQSQPWTFISRFMHRGVSQCLHFSEYVLLDDVYSQVLKPNYCVLPPPCTQQSHGGEEKYVILGVSSGLVLYGPYGRSMKDLNAHCRLYICNHVTGQWIALPPLTCQCLTFGWGFVAHVEDGFLKSCRVVRIDMLTERSNFIRFKVFFSEIGEWKNFTMSRELKHYYRWPRESTTLNGILHWIASEHGIIAYDPYQSPDRMRVIAFPSDIMNRQRQNAYNSLCAAYQEKLRYVEVFDEYIFGDAFPHFKLWVLNDYSSGDWCLQHNVSYTDVQHDTNLSFKLSILAPISFHPYNPDVVYLGYDNFLVSYNIKNKKLQVQQKFSGGRSCKERHLWWSGFLLVLPPWPISIPCSFSGAAKV